MRQLLWVLAVMVMVVPGRASAQDWDLFVSKDDGFKLDFPGTPSITEAPWKSEQGYTLPSKTYSVSRGQERYAITVVDYNGVVEMGIARNKTCPSGAETCQGLIAGPLRTVIGPGYAVQDIRGALIYAAFRFIQRDAKLTAFLWNWQDLVEGLELHLTNNADASRTMAYVAMHENKLYLLEGTVPKGYPEPGLFFQSLGWVDKDGNGIRYDEMYLNQMHGLRLAPVPPVRRPGAAAQPQGNGIR
jgi:hypothetical protein